MDTLSSLVEWYRSNCDGEWEHDFGVTIATLDNPGWLLTVDLEGTPLAGRTMETREMDRTQDDWMHVRSDGRQFVAAGGTRSLSQLIAAFDRFHRNA